MNKGQNHENRTLYCENHMPEADGWMFTNYQRHEAAATAASAGHR
jgi:hypothetical protein